MYSLASCICTFHVCLIGDIYERLPTHIGLVVIFSFLHYVQVSWKETNQEAIQVLFTLQAWHSVSSSTQFRVFFAYACLPLCRWLSIEKVHSDFIFKLSFFSFHTPECLLNSIQENFDALWDRVIDWPRYYTFLWYWEIHRPCVHGCICQMHSWRWLSFQDSFLIPSISCCL